VKNTDRKLACACVALFVLCAPGPVYAYLDPGAGSLLLQGLIAGLMAALVTLKVFWSRIKTFFGGSSAEEKQARDSNPDDGA